MTNDKMLQPFLDILQAQGISVQDLVRFSESSGGVSTNKTIEDYVEKVLVGLTRNTARSYRTHFMHLVNGVDRQCECTCPTCIEEFRQEQTCNCRCSTCGRASNFLAAGHLVVSQSNLNDLNLELLVQLVRRMAEKKALAENVTRARQGLSAKPTHGQGAQEMCVTALSSLFARMIRDGHIVRNPADLLPRGNRSSTTRRSLTDKELGELFSVVVSGGDDPDLDFAMTWAEFELGARRGGIVGLTIGQLDFESQMVTLREKGNRQDQQPC
jgi:site-specific recombinase XerD